MKKAHKQKVPYYLLTLKLSVRTKAQVKELKEVLLANYRRLVDGWCGRRPTDV